MSVVRSIWRIGAVVTIAGAAAALAPQLEAGEAIELKKAQARAAAAKLGEALKAELVAALQSGGPIAALGVCKTVAPTIAAKVSGEQGLEVGRTALKVRNPDNAPDNFERKILEGFVEKIASGSDPMTLEHAEIVADDNGVEWFRYMKAIPTAAEPCLKCHGSAIEPSLKAEIDKLYPGDQATGFNVGELRGAFSIRERVKPAE